MQIPGCKLNPALDRTISLAVETGRLPHAVIIEGGSATERSKLGDYLARSLVCSGSAKPCGRCAFCVKALADSSPDILRFSVDDKANAFKVDIIREIRGISFVLPNEADKKVFILENAHTMSFQAQNAFLKVLEEPPEYVNFILLCKTKENLLPTVLSRATVYYLGEASNDGEGGGKKAVEAACNIAEAVIAANELDIVVAAAVFEKNKDLLRLALPELEQIFVCALSAKYGSPYDDSYGDVPKSLALSLTAAKLLALTEQVRVLIGAIGMNANHNLMITRLCSSLRRAAAQ